MSLINDINDSNEQGLINYHKGLTHQINLYEEKDNLSEIDQKDLQGLKDALIVTKNRLGEIGINPDFAHFGTPLSQVQRDNKISSFKVGDSYMKIHKEIESINDFIHVMTNWDFFARHGGKYKSKTYSEPTPETLQEVIPSMKDKRIELLKELDKRRKNDRQHSRY